MAWTWVSARGTKNELLMLQASLARVPSKLERGCGTRTVRCTHPDPAPPALFTDPRLTVLPVDTPVADVQTVADAVMRYYFYLEEGISERHIAPYRDEWAANALTLIPQTAPPGVSEEFYYEMVESSILEMHR